MKVHITVTGWGGEFGQSIVKGTGDEREDLISLQTIRDRVMEDRDPSEMDSVINGVINYSITVRKDDENGDVLFEDEDYTDNDFDELELGENEYAIRYSSEEKGMWLSGEYEFDDAVVEKYIAENMAGNDGDRDQTIRDFLGESIEFHRESIDGFKTVCDCLMINGEECSEPGDTNRKAVEMKAINSSGQEIDLDMDPDDI